MQRARGGCLALIGCTASADSWLRLLLVALQMDRTSLLKQFEHLDPHNQNTFEAKDLELLISTVSRSGGPGKRRLVRPRDPPRFQPLFWFCRPPKTWRTTTRSDTRSSSATRC